MKVKKSEIIIFLLLLVVALVTRTIMDFGPNIELVSAVSLAGGFFLKSKLKFLLPFLIMSITDLYLGNTIIFMFTWSAYLSIPMFSKLINGKSIQDFYTSSIGSGVIFVMFFYLWTNLGVVLVSNLYPKTIEGLLSSYINALPFLGNQLFSVVLTVPIVFTFILLLKGNLLFLHGSELVNSTQN